MVNENQDNKRKKYNDIERIKKHYGEKFARLCRTLFQSILEDDENTQEDVKENKLSLFDIISNNFDNVPSLYDDIYPVKNDFQAFVLNLAKKGNLHADIKTNKTPEQLMDEAGYILFPEITTKRALNKFKKFYAFGEQLCTFRDNRLEYCRVWFAVKKDFFKINPITGKYVLKRKKDFPIKREDFPNPDRQDAYGTSVISIQFTKGDFACLSIKNRWNDIVPCPDNTFYNNLELIQKGLTHAFKVYKNVNLDNYNLNNANTCLHEYLFDKKYARAITNKFYKKVNTITDGYACMNNIVVKDNKEVVYFDKSKYILFEDYLIDLTCKKIINISKIKNISNKTIEDIFDCLNKNEKPTSPVIDTFLETIGEIDSIKVSLDENKDRVVSLFPKGKEKISITINKSFQMTKYCDSNIKFVPRHYLLKNKNLEQLSLPNAEQIEKNFMPNNEVLTTLDLPNVKIIDNDFLTKNMSITSINLPNVKTIGNNFLKKCYNLNKINMPNVENIGYDFNSYNNTITSISLPKVQNISNDFMPENTTILNLNLPNLKTVGERFLRDNKKLRNLYAPNITECGKDFLKSNARKKHLLKNKSKNKSNEKSELSFE